jgi:hypothetical protein
VESSSGTSVPTRLPFAGTQTAEANQTPYVIERVILTTEINADSSPANEVSALSQEQQLIYLTVRVRDLPDGTRFRAIWFENDEVIGQSDERVERVEESVTWVALPFRSIAALNPSATHLVELIVNDRRVETFAFRVGVGAASDVIAETTFALGTDDNGQPVSAGEVFNRSASQIVLVARISNVVDPTGMIFSSYWMRGNVLLAQLAPDGGQPRLQSDPADPADRIMTFIFAPDSPMLPGDYTVFLHLNGAEMAGFNFTISSEEGSAEDGEPTEPPEPTATPVVSGVSLVDLVIAAGINEETSEPDGERLQMIETYPGEQVTVFVSIALADLRIDDVVEFTVGIDNSIIDRFRLPVAAIESGWLSTELEIRAPDLPNSAVEYEITVYLDGIRARGTTVLVETTLDPPAEEEDDDDDDS